jgi:hypothetical protein
MSDPSAFGFGHFVPGFDFLKNLAQSSKQVQPGAAAMPGMGSWVAPTLSIEELDKRIQELKAVQFWLDQNATALKATIQAMEVQKMTLSTLQGMNVNMADLAKAFTASVPSTQTAAEAPETPAATSAPEPSPEPAAKAPAVDPMQWWGALTQQFQNIAASALKDVAAQALKDAPAQAKDSPKKASRSTTRSSKNVNKSATPTKTSSASTARKRTAAQAVKAPARQRD